jgi:hypothetical protein
MDSLLERPPKECAVDVALHVSLSVPGAKNVPPSKGTSSANRRRLPILPIASIAMGLRIITMCSTALQPMQEKHFDVLPVLALIVLQYALGICNRWKKLTSASAFSTSPRHVKPMPIVLLVMALLNVLVLLVLLLVLIVLVKGLLCAPLPVVTRADRMRKLSVAQGAWSLSNPPPTTTSWPIRSNS